MPRATPPPATLPKKTRIRSALSDFLATEAAGGALLVAAAAAAVIWANSPWAAGHDRLFSVDLGPLDLHDWINDGLMALFFFVVGLEISRELTTGELRQPRAAALPVLAALGGMVVPALVFLAFTLSGPGARGWGIPMATDIAFAVGVLALLGSRVPSPVKLFLLALAIVDDLGAILVIAVAYSDGVNLLWLGGAVAAIAGVWLAKGNPVVLIVLGSVAWWCTHESGVHATIAGVALGFAVPAGRGESYEHRLHRVTTFLVVPLFALANAAVALSGDAFGGEAGRVALGVAAGLIVGKVVGISGATWLALRLGAATLPEGMRFAHVVGAGALAGIGFTVSLFITELAFPGRPELLAGAKVAILGASVAAAVVGAGLLAFAARARTRQGPGVVAEPST